MLCHEYVVDSEASDRTLAGIVDDLHKVFDTIVCLLRCFQLCLEKVQTGRYVLENGVLIKIGDQPTPHFKSKQFEEQDKLDTADAHYRHKLMMRTMKRWQRFLCFVFSVLVMTGLFFLFL
jgi:hypothetical protein